MATAEVYHICNWTNVDIPWRRKNNSTLGTGMCVFTHVQQEPFDSESNSGLSLNRVVWKLMEGCCRWCTV